MNVRITHSRAPALALTVAVACAAALPVQATEHKSSKQETIGVTSGLAVGALAGGPFGAVIGAAVGAMLGDHFHKQKVDNASLATDLNESKLERAKLQASLAELQSRGDELAQMLAQRRDLETQVTFRTGDAVLPAGAALQLQKLGALVSTMPNVRVRVSGYADPRGTEEFNTALSQERADAVAQALASSGMDAGRVVVEAHGESTSTSAEGDLDGYALDRRVVIRIEQNAEKAVAQRN